MNNVHEINVLVLEDNYNSRNMLGKTIQYIDTLYTDAKITPILCGNIYDAKKAFINDKIDIIVADFMLGSQETGLDFVKWVQNIKTTDIPILVTTAINDYQVHKDFITSGATAIFLKPLVENFKRGLNLSLAQCVITKEKQSLKLVI